jgi:hypothetical protein
LQASFATILIMGPRQETAPRTVRISSADEYIPQDSQHSEAPREYNMRKVEIPLGEETISFNPVVTLLGIAILWGLTIWAISK